MRHDEDVRDSWQDAINGSNVTGSKHARLVKAITADIETGAMHIGERLPVQRLLAEALGVSVQTVQSAYKELERQGFIRCDVGRGSFVAARVSDSMSNFILDTADRVRMDFSTNRIVRTPVHDAEWRR